MSQPINTDIIKTRIVERRKTLRLNQTQLAQQAGVTPAAISQIESGDRVPTIPVLHRIATVLKVSLDYLTGKTDDSELKDLLQNEEVREFFRGFQSLSERDRDVIKRQMEIMKKMESEGEK